jgi:hypothetical protein
MNQANCKTINFEHKKIKALALVLSFVHISFYLYSQHSIAGTVKDLKTNEPLPGATVYLASTTLGTSANETGTFSLNKISPGKYDLVVSMVGYKLFSKPILINRSVKDFTVYLDEEVKQLNAIEVKAKRKINRVEYEEFKKIFIGQTKNSSQCKIVNIHDIFVYKDKAELHAISQKPIEILNNALGYRIYFDLKEFVIDYIYNSVIMSGIPRFENLTPESKKEETRWKAERDRAYYGSVEHFLRSLRKRELKNNSFTVFDFHNREINEDFLLPMGTDSILYYKGILNIVFSRERPEYFYNKNISKQISTLNFANERTEIYSNGYYREDQHIILQGYMGWSCRIADMVPLGYQPIKPLK